jgi:pimeloyl-ACP methyl ester carboxylesterase
MARLPRRIFGPLLAFGMVLWVSGRAAHAETGNGLPPVPPEVVESWPAPPVLPDGVEVGVPTVVPVPGDRQLLVFHAKASNQRAILYMHGHCGNVHAVESWSEVLADSGTLIAVLGDRNCGNGRFKWGKRLDLIQARLSNALTVVKAARGGLLDIEAPILFGYSQGADRAEVLVARYGQRYRRVVLGGASRKPRLSRLGSTEAVAVFGGELEMTGHLRAGAEVLAAAGKSARFFLLPGAKHGQFGPEGKRVMNEVFSWLFVDGS